MDLFEMVEGHVHPSIHALLIEPYKSMWENDYSHSHEDSIRDFTFVELLCSPKKSNIFYQYSEDDRLAKLKEHVYRNVDHQLSNDVLLAIIAYKRSLTETLSYELCNSAINAAHKVRQFLDTYDPSQETRGGMLVLKPREILMALQEVPDTIEKLEKAREKVHSDLSEASKTRNQREINMFER